MSASRASGTSSNRMAPAARVLLIGWDGATWDLARPWMQAGELPHLKSLVERGAHGELASTEPAMTFPAWSTFLTGRDPGGHGIYDFTERLPGRYTVRLVNARAREAPTIWRLLSDAGLRVCSIAVPVTWPPEDVNGAMISGFDAPGVGAVADASSMHPPELLEELRRAVGEYRIASHIAPLVEEGRHEEALDRVLETLDRKGETALYLLGKGDWDAFMVLFGESDLAGHHFWRFHDPSSPFHEEAGERVAGAMLEVYRRLDHWTGRLMEAAGEGALVALMSDHGFGAAGDKQVRLNAWLAGRGHLVFQGGGAGVKDLVLGLAKRAGMRVLPQRLRRLLIRRAGALVGSIEAGLRFGRIDLPRTRAFSEETPHFPAIWINLRGREEAGCVEPGAEYEELRDHILEELRAWNDPETGLPLVDAAWRREELYHGPCVERAPDIVLRWALDAHGRTLQNGRSTGAPDERPLDRVDTTDPKWRLNKSGSHRPEGIVALSGSGVRRGEIEGAAIRDLAPTVMWLLGQAVPAGMDGKVLEKAFEEDFVERFPPRCEDAASDASADEDSGYSAEEEEIVAERLRGMGYLE